MQQRWTLLILTCLLLTGVSHALAGGSIFQPKQPKLPIVRLVMNDTQFNLELAHTQEDLIRGLMHRESIPKNGGMLFTFKEPQRKSFWMKNTLIPLDMIFLRNHKIVHVVHNAIPCKQDPCPTYSSLVPIDMVIEVNAGVAKEIGLQLGQTVQFGGTTVKIHQTNPMPSIAPQSF